MIVSYRYRFIFVKTPKTAGSSIEAALSPLCGDDDVFTLLNPAEPGHLPRNYAELRDRFAPVGAAAGSVRAGSAPERDAALAAAFAEGMPDEALEHLPAWFLAAALPDLWDDFTTFCVERNPWDKCVSAYHYFRAHNPGLDAGFASHLPAALAMVGGGSSYLGADGSVLVDRILRYEDLEAELADQLGALGVPFRGLHHRAKGGFRPPGDYRSYYDDELREQVARHCAREIDELGYTF